MKQHTHNLPPVLRHAVRSALIIILIFLIYLSQKSYAQVGTLNTMNQPVSPNAAALGKFVEMPVSGFSGLPDINIPLYNIPLRGTSLPLTLAYHASGVKVRDVPGYVGAGWALPIGSITRIVRGMTDGNDMSNPGPYKAGIETMGWPGGQAYPDYRAMVGVTSEQYVGEQNKIDTEFDLFYFNVMGRSCRFTFNKYGQPVTLDGSNLKISYGGGYYDGAFSVTDPDNNFVYDFNKAEHVTNTLYPSISSWYLTAITPPIGPPVTITYKTYPSGTTGGNLYGKPSYFQKVRYSDISAYYYSIPYAVLNPVCSEQISLSASVADLMGPDEGRVVVEKILFGTDSVRFYTNNNRLDLYKVKLDSIKVFHGASAVQAVRFGYSYNHTLPNANSKKLLLSSLQINDQNPYTFNYFDSYFGKPMAGVYARGEDFWGFYNGEDEPGPEGSPPRFRSLIYGQTSNGGNSSYRNPDYRYGQLGSLKSITYPTGGRTELEYEGNDFSEGFTGGAPEDDRSIMLLLDSVRTVDLIGHTQVGESHPMGYTTTRELLLHHGQTVAVSSTIALDQSITSLADYTSNIYNGGTGYAVTVRIYKFNTTTGVFDQIEERSFNPVDVIGLPYSEMSFEAARPGAISMESHNLSLTEGRYKLEVEIPAYANGLVAQITLTDEFKYRRYVQGSGFYIDYKYKGGIRIKKLKFISPVNSASFEKNYEYTNGNKSSGWLENPFANVTTTMYWGNYRLGDICPQVCNFYLFNFDSVIPLGNAQGGVIGYSKVTEKMDNGSKKITYYSVLQDGYNFDYLGDIPIIDRITLDNSEFRGKPLFEEYFNGSQKVKTISKSYTSFSTDAVKNLYARLQGLSGSSCGMPGDPGFNNYGQWWGAYSHQQTKVLSLLETVKDYTPTDSLSNTIKYAYTNSEHGVYPKRITQITATGDSTVTQHVYSWEFNYGSANPYAAGFYPAFSHAPIESYTTNYIGGTGKVTSATFKSFNSHMLEPDTVFTLSSTAGLTDFKPSNLAGRSLAIDSRYQRQQIVSKFNNKNVVEQRQIGNSNEVLLWGYQHKYLVARVSGSDYTTVRALVDTTIVNNPSSDAALRSTLNNIRSALASSNPSAMVTTYTYDPLKGMSSMTDQKGELTYYTFDAYGKLKFSKNHDGLIKQRVNYHFKP